MNPLPIFTSLPPKKQKTNKTKKQKQKQKKKNPKTKTNNNKTTHKTSQKPFVRDKFQIEKLKNSQISFPFKIQRPKTSFQSQ